MQDVEIDLNHPGWISLRYKVALWKPRAQKHALELEKRIHALKGKVYPGYGFHYGWVEDITKTRRLIDELDPPTDTWQSVICEVRLEGLEEEVKKAEQYVRENSQQ